MQSHTCDSNACLKALYDRNLSSLIPAVDIQYDDYDS